MDLFTKKIHLLLCIEYTSYERSAPVTVSDLQELAFRTNEISEVVIEKKVFIPKKNFSDEINQSIKKLAKSGDIVLKEWEEVKELEEDDRIMIVSQRYSSDPYIFLNELLFELPDGISEDEATSMKYAIATTLERDRDAPLSIGTLLRALEWAIVVQTEKLGFPTERQERKALAQKIQEQEKQKAENKRKKPKT